MKKQFFWTTLTIGLLLVIVSSVSALTIDIYVNQEATLKPDAPDTNYKDFSQYLWVGYNATPRGNFESMFGFDVSAITSLIEVNENLIINSMSLNAYQNYSLHDGNVNIGLGNTDDWDDNVVTWNTSYGDHGTSIASTYVTSAPLTQWVSWDITSISVNELLDNYLTFYLFTTPEYEMNWHDFENSEYSGTNEAFLSHEAFLSIDYDIVQSESPVPEPATLLLLSTGLAGLFGINRIKKESSI